MFSPLSRLFRLILLLCTVVSLFSCHPPQRPKPLYDKKDFPDIVKSRTMVLIVPDKELPYLEDYKQLLPQAWTVSPVKVITYKEAALYPPASEHYTYFGITLWAKSGARYALMGLDIPFRVPGSNKNRVKTPTLGEIDMGYNLNNSITSAKNKPVIEQLYTEAAIPGFNLPYMLAYLRLTQEKLLGEKKSREDYLEDKELLARLKKSTLYVTDSSFLNVADKHQKGKNLFATYPGKYEYISVDRLINMLKDKQKEPVFLFEYATGSFKYIRVWELRSLRTAYRKLTYGPLELNSKDIRKILE